MKQVTYTFTENSTESKPPEHGRRYLVQFRNYAEGKCGIAVGKWNDETSRFEYDPCRFISKETPQALKSDRYFIIGWARIATDWEPVKEDGLMDTLRFRESKEKVSG